MSPASSAYAPLLLRCSSATLFTSSFCCSLAALISCGNRVSKKEGQVRQAVCCACY